MVEDEGKGNADDEQDCQHRLFVWDQEEANEIGDQNDDFGGHDIRHDRAYKEPFLTFENRVASGAARFDVEWPINNRRSATHRTQQFERAPQREGNRARISFHAPIFSKSLTG